MACASCGGKYHLEAFTQPYCPTCHSFLCRGCLTSGKKNGTGKTDEQARGGGAEPREHNEMRLEARPWERKRIRLGKGSQQGGRGRACPTCGTATTRPVSSSLAFIVLILFFGALIAMQSAITSVEEELAWDSMEVVPFETAEDREYIKIAGRIDSGSNVTLDRVIHPNGSREWRVMDFNLTYGNSSIFVNMSDYDTIVRNEANDHPNGSYLDGELVYVAGLVYFDGDQRCILAYHVAYDTGIFEGMFRNYDFAFFVMIVGLLLNVHMWSAPLVARLLFPPLERLRAVPQDDVRQPRAGRHDRGRTLSDQSKPSSSFGPSKPSSSFGPPGLSGSFGPSSPSSASDRPGSSALFSPSPLPPASRRLENGMIVVVSTLLVLSLVWVTYLILFFLSGENIFGSMEEWEAFLGMMYLSLATGIFLTLILAIYPEVMIYRELTDYHLHYAFGFGPPQMLDWKEVVSVKRLPCALRLITGNDEVLLFPLFRSHVRNEIEGKALESS